MHHGIYRGVVVNNDDPEQRSRLLVRVPSLTGDAVVGWVWPCLPPVAPEDLVLPEPGDGVWVMYEAGDPDYPIWLGVF
jgi:hypothetical protein